MTACSPEARTAPLPQTTASDHCATGAASSGKLGPPSILVLTDYFLPGFKAGGVLRTLAYLTDRLGEEYRFKIVTRDRDLGDRLPYRLVEPGTWRQVGQAEVLYLPPAERRVSRIRRIIAATPHDLLYLTSVFSPDFTIKPLLLRWLGLVPQRPTVLAAHGELYPGALASKRAKKRLYLELAPRLGLYSGVVCQAPDSEGVRHVRRWLGRQTDVEVGGILALPSPSGSGERKRKRPGRLDLLYLSRISPHKNLAGALDMLRDVSCEVNFDIYGPADEDPGYWRKCNALIATLPTNVRVRYMGSVAPDAVCDTMAAYDLLLLPTHGENFGHVICEALTSGCPVLTSDRTPWRELEREQAGWSLPIEAPDLFRRAIENCAAMDESAHSRLRDGARALAARRASSSRAIEQHRTLFQRVLAAAAR